MATSKVFRRWILGLSCSVVPLMGCAQGPAPKTNRLFPWFRSAPLSDSEKQKQEQLEAAEKLKDPANLHIKYAEWREQVGDLTDARKSYQVALQENPKSLEAKLGLARLDQLSGRTAEAEKAFQDILNNRPGDPRAIDALGQFFASQKQWAKALPLLEEAADAAPTELTYRHHFALALAQSGDMDAAYAQFRQTVGDAEAHYNIAYLLYDKGHKDLARGQLRLALGLNPNLKQAEALLDEIEGETGRAVVAAATKPVAYPPVHRVQPASSEVTLPPAAQDTQPAPSQEPRNWSPARQAAATLPAEPPVAPAAPASFPTAAVPPAAVPERAAPVHSQPPSVESPPSRPMWRKHQEPEATPQQTSEYLPPYPPQPGTHPASTQTPNISPAQREQWENQMKAAAAGQ